jgi:hypothetical protein
MQHPKAALQNKIIAKHSNQPLLNKIPNPTKPPKTKPLPAFTIIFQQISPIEIVPYSTLKTKNYRLVCEVENGDSL